MSEEVSNYWAWPTNFTEQNLRISFSGHWGIGLGLIADIMKLPPAGDPSVNANYGLFLNTNQNRLEYWSGRNVPECWISMTALVRDQEEAFLRWCEHNGIPEYESE